MADAKTERRCAGGVAYTLTRRRVRNLNLRVRADGTVSASAPQAIVIQRKKRSKKCFRTESLRQSL